MPRPRPRESPRLIEPNVLSVSDAEPAARRLAEAVTQGVNRQEPAERAAERRLAEAVTQGVNRQELAQLAAQQLLAFLQDPESAAKQLLAAFSADDIAKITRAIELTKPEEQVYLQRATGEYLTAEDGALTHEHILYNEGIFTQVDLKDGTVSFRTCDGRYVASDLTILTSAPSSATNGARQEAIPGRFLRDGSTGAVILLEETYSVVQNQTSFARRTWGLNQAVDPVGPHRPNDALNGCALGHPAAKTPVNVGNGARDDGAMGSSAERCSPQATTLSTTASATDHSPPRFGLSVADGYSTGAGTEGTSEGFSGDAEKQRLNGSVKALVKNVTYVEPEFSEEQKVDVKLGEDKPADSLPAIEDDELDNISDTYETIDAGEVPRGEASGKKKRRLPFLFRLVSHPKFHLSCVVVIMCHALTMGVATNEFATYAIDNIGYGNKGERPYQEGQQLETAFYIFYVFELVLKYVAYTQVNWSAARRKRGRARAKKRSDSSDTGTDSAGFKLLSTRICLDPLAYLMDCCPWLNDLWDQFCPATHEFFCGREGIWNSIDFSLVVVSTFSILDVGAGNMSWLRIWQAFQRLVKASRILRVVKHIRELRVIMLSIAHSFSSFFWSCATMALIMYMASILLVQGVATYLYDTPGEQILDEVRTVAIEDWGGMFLAMITLFKAIAGGGPWGIYTDPLEEAGLFYFVFFLFYIAFFVVALLKLLTGIFMKHAADAHKNIQDDMVKHKMLEMFEKIDEGHTGRIAPEEFKKHLNNYIAHGFMATLKIDPKDHEHLFKSLDTKNTGDLDFEEFCDGCQRFGHEAKNIDIITAVGRINAVQSKVNELSDLLVDFMSRVHPDYVPVPVLTSISTSVPNARGSLGLRT